MLFKIFTAIIFVLLLLTVIYLWVVLKTKKPLNVERVEKNIENLVGIDCACAAAFAFVALVLS